MLQKLVAGAQSNARLAGTLLSEKGGGRELRVGLFGGPSAASSAEQTAPEGLKTMSWLEATRRPRVNFPAKGGQKPNPGAWPLGLEAWLSNRKCARVTHAYEVGPIVACLLSISISNSLHVSLFKYPEVPWILF